MPEADDPNEVNIPQLPADQGPGQAEVDLEQLALEIWKVLKASLREENDRLGKIL